MEHCLMLLSVFSSNMSLWCQCDTCLHRAQVFMETQQQLYWKFWTQSRTVTLWTTTWMCHLICPKWCSLPQLTAPKPFLQLCLTAWNWSMSKGTHRYSCSLKHSIHSPWKCCAPSYVTLHCLHSKYVYYKYLF